MVKNVDNFDINLISKKSPLGYILEVDLEYPDKLHAFHNDYPLVLEKPTIPYNILSGYCDKIPDKHKTKVDGFRLVNNKNDFLKYTSRPTHITH